MLKVGLNDTNTKVTLIMLDIHIYHSDLICNFQANFARLTNR